MGNRIDTQYGINSLVSREGLRLPHGVRPGQGIDGRFTTLFTEEEWEDYGWNPPDAGRHLRHYSKFDPNASPKPSWASILEGIRYHNIWESKRFADWHANNTSEHREKLTDRDLLTVSGKEIHVGDGLDHMTGLLQIVEQANIAGLNIPNVILRDKDGVSTPMWTQSGIREVLDAAAERENRVESAHNTVWQKYKEYADIRDDEAGTLEAREEAANKAKEYITNYETHLKKAIEDYDPDVLPTDLTDLKAVYQERLEAAALRKVKDLKGVLTQQGIDLPPSCVDEENALTEVSEHCTLGIIDIHRATDAAEAKTAFDAAVVLIDNVSALNTPQYMIGSARYGNGQTASTDSNTVTVAAKHPDTSIPGRVMGTYVVTEGDPAKIRGTYLTFGPSRDKELWLKLDAINAAGESFAIQFKTRNLCGSSFMTINLAVPA